jgi:protein phosphatase
MEINIPTLSLVILIGPSGSGKSTFAKAHFAPTEVISSDYCRALVCDDENSLEATRDAFDLLHYIVEKRLARGKLTVVDATSIRANDRKPLVQLARQYHVFPVAIALTIPKKVCQTRNARRTERADMNPTVVHRQYSQMRRSLGSLGREGFRYIYKLESEEIVNAATVTRSKLWNDKKQEHGPFDIIGDVHGCFDELADLLGKLGYAITGKSTVPAFEGPIYAHPEGRKVVFIGDLVDRGPRILDTLRLVYNMVKSGHALCLPGNHDIKLLRKLNGRNVQMTHGLPNSIDEIEKLPPHDREQFVNTAKEFLNSLISHYVLDDGKLVVAHAGLVEEMQGRGSAKVREFCLYGETTGETDEFGLPIRYNWAADYRGKAMVVYGHTPVPQPEWLNHTINIDTGCVYGGKLTVLRYPERTILSVPAKKMYSEPKRLSQIDVKSNLTEQQQIDDILDAQDVIGKHIISTRFQHNITIREENAAAALEVMSRFATNPKWLIYLPPTMSPCETSTKEGYLEYPTEAFSYFRIRGIPRVVCEEKHMGSRAVVVLCKSKKVALQRFGIESEDVGIVYSRTGRPFFDNKELEQLLLNRLLDALNHAKFWQKHETDWLALDCELLPWSAKAVSLIQSQFASVSAAGSAALKDVIASLKKANKRPDLQVSEQDNLRAILAEHQERNVAINKYRKAYQEYCWDVLSIDDIKLAPFHILATEGRVHSDKSNVWHMNEIAQFVERATENFIKTPYKIVDVTDEQSVQEGEEWWNRLTSKGGEGMVVKPYDFIVRGNKGYVQPALKCRGREYLRIIYGPEYTFEKNLKRLRKRALGLKRSLAMREFALGMEALERFVRREPLRRTHQCVFGVLALESEPVDPRL